MINKIKILFDHPAFRLNLINESIVNAHHKEGLMSIDDFKLMLKKVEEFSKSYGKLYVVNTNEPLFKFANDTWKFVQSKEFDPSDFILVQALIAQELHYRVLAKLHLKIKPSKTKMKVFSNLEDGVKWLTQLANNT